ncbi:hypothetical protein BS17DRAFT_813212 [Gyrodon lividus]|nr:hypothetical protein BS17DRAFT_813212 [Gyrodon lividus]
MSPHLRSMSHPPTHDVGTTPALAASTTQVTPPGAKETHTTASAAVTPTFLVAPSQPSVKAICISQSDLEKIEILWEEQLDIMEQCHAEFASAEPWDAANWDLNNLCIIVALQTCSTPEEQAYLCKYTNAHLAWSSLQQCHAQIGPITETLLIQKLLQVHYCRTKHFATTSLAISDDICHVFSMGLPTYHDDEFNV